MFLTRLVTSSFIPWFSSAMISSRLPSLAALLSFSSSSYSDRTITGHTLNGASLVWFQANITEEIRLMFPWTRAFRSRVEQVTYMKSYVPLNKNVSKPHGTSYQPTILSPQRACTMMMLVSRSQIIEREELSIVLCVCLPCCWTKTY